MADLLIKGMEMPKDEYVDVRIFKDGRVIANQADANEPNSHYATFTAIAVPTHGRLIDADALLNSTPELESDWFENCSNCKCLDSEGLKRLITEAPTVLEASND